MMGREISGNLQLPEAQSFPKSKEGIAPVPPMFVYMVPVGEIGRQVHRAQIYENGTFAAKQIAPGTYRLLAFDHFRPELLELGLANSELMRKLRDKGCGSGAVPPSRRCGFRPRCNLVNEP